jgi:hypothetical protein
LGVRDVKNRTFPQRNFSFSKLLKNSTFAPANNQKQNTHSTPYIYIQWKT